MTFVSKDEKSLAVLFFNRNRARYSPGATASRSWKAKRCLAWAWYWSELSLRGISSVLSKMVAPRPSSSLKTSSKLA